jgi:rhamnosyltransferase
MRFIEPQLKSLKENATSFTLHWLDDQSTDGTREAIRAIALSFGIELVEWHQEHSQGIPATYFYLLEQAEADIYLFCDQDDIWQPGKLDAFVDDLVHDLSTPTLCFSEPLVFSNEQPTIFRRLTDTLRLETTASLQESRLFMHNPAFGHSTGFTRPLRDLFLKHKDIARKYALMHDWWMYIIAQASGTCRMLYNVPTTLYRRHGKNWSEFAYSIQSARTIRVLRMLRLQQQLRPMYARQARGFILASETLPAGRKLDQFLLLARRVAILDRRQSPIALARLLRSRAMYPDMESMISLSVVCLCSEAKR